MKLQERIFLDFGEIDGVRLECAKCGGAVTVPLTSDVGEIASGIAMAPCRFCKTSLGFQIGSAELRVFAQFSQLLQNLGPAMKNRNLKLGFEIRGTN